MSSWRAPTGAGSGRLNEAPDVAVVGGGLIGCSVARALARRGATVIVIERGVPGRGSTWAAAGMLSPTPEPDEPPAFRTLAAASFARYPAYVEALHSEAGIDAEFEESGRIHVAADARRAAGLPALLRRAAPFGAEQLGAAAALALEPALAPTLSGAVRIAHDARIDNRKLGAAAWAAAANAGVEFRLGDAAVELCHDDGRFRAVRLASGDMVDAGAVVVAGGAWCAEIGGLPRTLPVRPARGQMLAVAAGAGPARPAHATFHRTITSDDVYLVPRRDGRLLIGATVEDVGFAPGPTLAGLRSLIEAALAIAPVIADLPVLEVWAGFRPATPDGLPILGRDPDAPGVYYAAGHFRNGILLAPITADVLADCLAGAEPPVEIDAFDVSRFDEPTAPRVVSGRGPHDRAEADAMTGEQEARASAARPVTHRKNAPRSAGTIVDRADYDPTFDPDAPIRCERCGGEMEYTSSCKIVCRTCGMMRDCGDP